MKILLAADGSEYGTAALKAASRMLIEKNNVNVVSVVPHLHPRNGGMQGKLLRRGARIAEGLSEALTQEGISAKPIVHTGSPAHRLIHCAQNYDLIVISAKSRKGRSADGMGPVASRVLEHAPVTTLLARSPQAGLPPKILIPVDGSDVMFEALEKVQTIIDVTASEITLLHVVETPWIIDLDDEELIPADTSQNQGLPLDLEQEFTREAEGLLEKARERLPSQASVNTLVYRGIPSEEILSEANTGEYDLIVLATTGAQDMKHKILGSVSSKVAWNAPCSVLLIRPCD